MCVYIFLACYNYRVALRCDFQIILKPVPPYLFLVSSEYFSLINFSDGGLLPKN